MSSSRSFSLLGFLFLTVAALAQSAALVPVYRWTTLAGRASNGSDDGPASNAQFSHPHGLAMDLAGNLYVADANNHTIRKITTDGTVSTLAGVANQPGSIDGTGSATRFNQPQGLAVDRNGNVYVADTGNHTIRKITPAGVVTTLAGQAGKSGTADGAASVALFDSPDRLTVDANGTVYLNNHGVRKISGGQVQTMQLPTQALETNGQLTTVGISGCPAVDATGQLFFWGYASGASSPAYGRILKLDLAGTLTAFPTQYDPSLGTGHNAVFNDVSGNIFVTEDYLHLASGQQAFRGFSLQSLIDTSFNSPPGVNFIDGIGVATTPQGIAVDQAGHWYYTRSTDDVIVRDTNIFAGIQRQAVDGIGSSARFDRVGYVNADVSGNIWVAENPVKYTPQISGPSTAYAIRLRKVSPGGVVTTEFSTAFNLNIASDPIGLAADGAGQVYLGDYEQGPVTIYQIAPAEAAVPISFIQGNDPFFDLASDLAGNLWAYFPADGKIDRRPATGTWSPVAGGGSNAIKDGAGNQASFGNLWSLKADQAGNCFALDQLKAADDSLQACFIRKIKPDGSVTTVSQNLLVQSGTGINLSQSYPGSLVVDSHGQLFLTRDNGIVLFDAAGHETPVGGKATVAGEADGIGDHALFTIPTYLSIDGQDNLYVMDNYASVVRKGEFLGYLPGITSQPQSLTVAAGNSAEFSVTGSSTPAPSYQWYFNGNAVGGATSSTLSFAHAGSTDAGDYTVVVTNALGSVTSGKATLTVSSAPPTATSGSHGGGSMEAWFALALAGLSLISQRRTLRQP